jgi:ABC-type Fe3+-siderophore transport system permease subunit
LSRAITIVVLILALGPAGASAQQTSGTNKTTPDNARVKIWVGAGLAAAGLLVFPITAGSDQPAHPVIGTTLMGGGAALIWWGAREKRRAAQPETRIGVSLLRGARVQVRRVW